MVEVVDEEELDFDDEDLLLLDRLDNEELDETDDSPATVDVEELEELSVELLDSSSYHKMLNRSEVKPTGGYDVETHSVLTN